LTPLPSALELACAIRDGRTTAVDALEASLRRIDARQPDLRAFTRTWPDRARRAARQRDRAEPSGVFHGVPLGIKDVDPVAGALTQMGSRSTRWLWTPVDGPLTRRARPGGFTLVGKLQTSEFAILPVTETDIHPPCRNPWRTDLTCGGSSGGSAAAVAAGLLPLAHASDGAGSIRIPAAFCHLHGHKPSRELLPRFYAATDPHAIAVSNCVARTVRDSAAMLDVLLARSYDPRAPPEDSLLAACDRPPQKLRIRVIAESPLVAVDPVIAEAVRSTAELLSELGHSVVPGTPLETSPDDFVDVFAWMMSRLPVLWEAHLQPATRWLRARGRGVSGDDAGAAAARVGALVRDWFGDADAYLLPACGVLPPPVGAWRDLDGDAVFERALPLGAFTAPFNASGQPAATIPAGITPDGRPYAVQIAGRPGDDATVLALCAQLEAARPWRHRYARLDEELP